MSMTELISEIKIELEHVLFGYKMINAVYEALNNKVPASFFKPDGEMI